MSVLLWIFSFHITLACDVFKVEYMIADFTAVYYAESKNPTQFF